MYSFINPIGLSSKSYEDRDIAIREYLNCNKVLFKSNGDFINIQTIETELPTIVPFVLPKKKSDELIVELGVNELGKKVEINFSKTHSWLIAGATGSGKSVCTHNILTQLYCNYSYNTEFYICDMKKVELNNYRNLKSTIEYVDKVEDVERIIDKLLKLCDQRHELFIKYKVKNLQQYNKKVRKQEQLPNVVLCIEECVRLIGDKVLQAKIAELCFIARSAGIIVIMTIQRCTKNLMSGDIKASLLGKMGFKTVNRINSQVIMDDDRLFKIKEKGVCAIQSEDISIGETNVKVMYLEENRIDKILEKNCEYK
jgi:S-DNA-T family DNA segregation ATPase FtsK/SpoIIIE